jgi:putative hydrolase of the HAD superfamily
LVRAVTLDVGGTLIQPWPSVGHVYAAVASECGVSGLAPESLNHQFKLAWAARAPFDYSRAAWRELVNRTFAGLTPEPPSAECFERIYERFAHAEAWRIFPDVVPGLNLLRERSIRLGVITNWDERVTPLLEQLGLARWFEVIVVSYEVKSAKPDCAIFLEAAGRLGLDPAEILHVGDSAEEDVAGAEAAGYQTALLERGGAPGPRTVCGLESLLTRLI